MIADSCVWIEIFAEGPLGPKCEEALKVAPSVEVPAVVVFEVYKKIKKQISEELGLQVISYLGQYRQLDWTREIALLAGDLSLEFNLGMADSTVLAHARYLKTTLLTLDNDFRNIPDAVILRK